MNKEEGNKKKQWAAGLIVVLLVIAALAAWKFWPGKVETPVPGPLGEKKVSIQAAGDPAEALAGRKGQKAAGFIVKEESAGSLAVGQTIVLTLPDSARWESIGSINAANNLSLEIVKIEGSTAELKVAGASTSPTELVVKDLKISLEAGRTGPVAVKVSGSAGLTGEFTIVQATAPISVTAADKTSLVVGQRGQKMSDLMITESRSGSIADDKTIQVDLPRGIYFEGNPKAEVVKGDLKVGSVLQRDEKTLFIEITRGSTEPSSIRVQGISLYVDRVVPEGDAVFTIGGDAVNETGGEPDRAWPSSSVVATAAAAEVFTTQPIKTRFSIGSRRYTLNGVEGTLDTPPYQSNGVVYVSSKYAAKAVGATETSVNTDAAAGTVTLVREGRVVQLKVGSTSMLVNNASVPLDAAPVLEEGRIMLPIGPLAQAFGGTATLDNATNSVTVLVK